MDIDSASFLEKVSGAPAGGAAGRRCPPRAAGLPANARWWVRFPRRVKGIDFIIIKL
jgi:hypothetical protein